MTVEYYLMNKNVMLAKLGLNDNTAFIIQQHNSMPSYLENIQEWIDSRTTPFGRNNVKELLRLSNINTKSDYLDVTLGISLIDTLWVCRCDRKVYWENISPYTNRLSRIMAEIALNNKYVGGNLRSPSPDYKLDGALNKCWKRINGNICLIKNGGEKYSGITGNGPFNEFYATQIAEALGMQDYVSYDLKTKQTSEGYIAGYSICKAFTSERLGYLAIGYTKYTKYDIQELMQIVGDYNAELIREMLLFDSIIINVDRHVGNYGFLINNDTFYIEKMAPTFDYDHSFGSNISLQYNSIQEAYSEAIKKVPSTQCGTFVKQGKMMITDRLKSNMRNMYPFKFTRTSQPFDLDDNRIRFMEYTVNSQIRQILT